MASVKALTGLIRRGVYTPHGPRRLLHQTSTRHAITNLEMPAMSPTMTEGGIASWKKREGESFTAGDVLLEIETDKATIDVEAQDDGIMGKILLQDGAKNIPVGKVIALLAEEGDNISNLQPPQEEKLAPKQETSSSSSSKPTPTIPTTEASPPSHTSPPVSHSRPLFPSVQRLLVEFNVTKPEEIKGTGVRGMLTKGDVLAFLGKASGPFGTYKELSSVPIESAKSGKKEGPKSLDGPALRRLIVSTMLQSSMAARNPTPARETIPDFDSVISDYLPTAKSISEAIPSPSPPTVNNNTASYLDGLY